MDELLTMSVVEMAGRIRKGELSPVDALDAHVKRIEKVNPEINAVIVSRFEEAGKEAKKAEEKLAKKGKKKLPPLFGVPCTIKDTYALNGYPWAAGVWARKDVKADFDATVVKRIKDAGAIVMGKTNVPEAAMHNESYNHVYGRTKNPYDTNRGCGGSSGGEGAIIAAGGSPFGPGSDVGGSIRYPCAFNGIPGHKPTGRLVPGYGHWPPTSGPLAPYCCYGPMARRVEDLSYLLPIFAGPDEKDPIVEDIKIKPTESVNVDKLKVFYFDNNGMARTSSDIRRAIALAAGALTASKMEVEYWRPEGVEHALDIWQAGMAQNPGPPFKEILGDGKPIALGKELLRFFTRTGKITFPALGVAAIEGLAPLLAKRDQQFLALADKIRTDIEEKLGDDGVLICPVFSTVAPLHSRIWFDFLGIGYSGMINILEFPATILPIFHRPDGVPVSLQILGKRFNDHLTLAVASRLEEIFGGWKPIEKVGG